jgi:2-methylcitrate dehydratase
VSRDHSDIGWKDDVADTLATFSTATAPPANADHIAAAKRLLIDTIAVGLGAFDHIAAVRARDYMDLFPGDGDVATIWGAKRRASIDKAALVNGVLLRCYDFNDVMLGRKGAGHPSDMVAALVAVGEWRNAGGLELLQAIVLGYEIAEALHDVIPAEASGWDHANVSALGATCALGRSMALSADQMAEAFGIAAIQHIQSNEIESSALNRRGDLTMWKRFHGADAMRHALDACLLASVGVEAPVRPFQGKLGFLNIFGAGSDVAEVLQERLRPGNITGAVGRTNLKRWPVGSRAQSAIASALDARSRANGRAVQSVHVRASPAVYHHLVAIRQDPWRPISRETADHSLPYIVGAAVLDGFVNTSSFDPETVANPERARFIAEWVTVEASEDIAGRAPSDHLLSEVELRLADGSALKGVCRAAPGHRDNPLSEADLGEKLHENADPLLGEAGTQRLLDVLIHLERATVRELASLLSAPT